MTTSRRYGKKGVSKKGRKSRKVGRKSRRVRKMKGGTTIVDQKMKERDLTLNEKNVLKELNEKCIKAGNEILYKILKNDDDSITWDLGKINETAFGVFKTNKFSLLETEIPILYDKNTDQNTDHQNFKKTLKEKINLWKNMYSNVPSKDQGSFGIQFTGNLIRISGVNYDGYDPTSTTDYTLQIEPAILDNTFKQLLCNYYNEKKLYDIYVGDFEYIKFMKY
jgi:hypothetical protein